MWQASCYEDFLMNVVSFLAALICNTLSDSSAQWSLESKGNTGRPNWGQNWGNDKWPTRIFPHGLTVRTEGPQVAGSPLHQPGAICSEAAVESQIPERWCWEVGERESEMGSAINVTRITHYCSRKGTEAAFNESNLNLTWIKICHESQVKNSSSKTTAAEHYGHKNGVSLFLMRCIYL